MKQITAKIALVALMSSAATGTCFAQAYPSKPIRLIVPASAGSPPDVRARWLAEKLYPALGQRVVVEDMPGAGGNIGAARAARSAPDGYTLLAVTQGTLALNPHMYTESELGFDALTSFVPITRVSVGALMLATYLGVPAGSVAELMKLAKDKPGALIFGAPGIGSPPHMAGELFRRKAGIEVTYVPYSKGGHIVDLSAGRVTYTIDGIGVLLPHVKAGRIRALAVTSAQRLDSLPNVPTIAESGLPGFEYEAWTGICAPAGTPKAIVARLNVELAKILHTAEAREWFAEQGVRPVGDTPEEFAAYAKDEHTKWGVVIREARIKPE